MRVLQKMPCKIDIKGKKGRAIDRPLPSRICVAELLSVAKLEEKYKHQVMTFLRKNGFEPVKIWGPYLNVESRLFWITFPQARKLYTRFPFLRPLLELFVIDPRACGTAKTWAEQWVEVHKSHLII